MNQYKQTGRGALDLTQIQPRTGKWFMLELGLINSKAIR